MGILYCCCCCCFNNLYTRTLEIISIIFHSIQTIFLLICFIVIKWSIIPVINLAMFILMMMIILTNLTFIIMLRYWRAKGIIKTTKRNLGINIATIGFALIIICLIICIIEDFLISYGFYTANYPCINYKYNNDQNNNDYYYNGNIYYYKTRNSNRENIRNLSTDSDNDEFCADKETYYYAGVISDEEYILSYFTLSYLEISSVLGIWIWFLLRRRIIQGLDRPSISSTGQVLPAMYHQYGRQVVVVQPGDIVVMEGQQHVAVPVGQNNQYIDPYFPYKNDNNNQINNLPQTQNNQINNQPPGSQEYMQEKPH